MTTETRAPLGDGTRIGALWAANVLGPLAAFVVSLYAAALGWREWRRWGGTHAGDEGGAEGRSRFLALLGLLTGGFAALPVLAQWSANLFFHPCQ